MATTTVSDRLPTRVWRGGRLTVFAVTAAGCVALLARPWATPLVEDPTAMFLTLFVLLGAVGAWWPLRGDGRTTAEIRADAQLHPVLVAGIGVAAFGVARVLASTPASGPLVGQVVALHVLAAIAEEAFFRRLVYGALLRRGEAVAVVGSAVAFAAVHVTVWGFWVLPVDVAAGVILSWQRWACGRWSVPAVTHAFANLAAVA